MRAWVPGDPEQLSMVEKPVPAPGAAEVLVRVDAIAVCATDIDDAIKVVVQIHGN